MPSVPRAAPRRHQVRVEPPKPSLPPPPKSLLLDAFGLAPRFEPDWRAIEEARPCVDLDQGLVSALCVTRGRRQHLERALACFDTQTYPHRELVVVFESLEPPLRRKLEAHPRVRLVPVPESPKQPLGELRNLSVRASSGRYVCCWDDDDWYAPRRIEAMLRALIEQEADACLLDRWLVLDETLGRAYASQVQPWQGTLFCRRDLLLDCTYPALPRDEDRLLVEELLARHRVTCLSAPELYVYTYHGENTWDALHFAAIFENSVELDRASFARLSRLVSFAKPGPDTPEASAVHAPSSREIEAFFHSAVVRQEGRYFPRLPVDERGTFEVPRELRVAEGVEYACANPSVVRWRDRTYANVRLVNYRQEHAVRYVCPDPAGVFRTRNVTLEWDARRARADWVLEAAPGIPATWHSDSPIVGVEDIRFAVHGDRVWFTATSGQVPGHRGSPQVVLGRMNERMDAIEHLVPIRYAGARAIEKNWVPWPHEDRLLVVYSFDPLIVLEVDEASGEASTLAERRPGLFDTRWRGSTSLLPLAGGGTFIALVHEVSLFAKKSVYTHRWVMLDEYFALLGFSPEFVFDHEGVEYAAGLCESHDGRLLVSYGFEDREARWVAVERSAVLDSIERVDSWRGV